MIDISTHRLGTEPTLHKREVPAPKTRGKGSLSCFIRTYDLFRSSELTGTSANLTESLGTHCAICAFYTGDDVCQDVCVPGNNQIILELIRSATFFYKLLNR